MKGAKKKHIIIIGAGMAGLTAAYELSQHEKYEITLLEQEDHIGGRTHTHAVENVPVDVGGFIIYPWYKTFHALIKKLHIQNKLTHLPHLEIFYQLEKNGALLSGKEIPLSFKTKSLLAAKLLPTFLNNLAVASPNLTAYQEKTVRAFLRTGTPRINDPLLERYIDTICEGYCYPSSATYKAAFMFPMMGSNLFFGDIQTASYFPQGIQEVIHALQTELERKGVRILLNTPVQRVTKTTAITSKGTLSGDVIIISHPINNNIPYTRFVTLTFACNTQPLLTTGKPWGALFLHRSVCKDIHILSIIHTSELYSSSLNTTLTLNIALNATEETPAKSAAYAKRISKELAPFFPNSTQGTITSLTHWKRTMPQSNEKLVKKMLKEQGKDGIFYAGDVLGCPSIETAATTGTNAARAVVKYFANQKA